MRPQYPNTFAGSIWSMSWVAGGTSLIRNTLIMSQPDVKFSLTLLVYIGCLFTLMWILTQSCVVNCLHAIFTDFLWQPVLWSCSFSFSFLPVLCEALWNDVSSLVNVLSLRIHPPWQSNHIIWSYFASNDGVQIVLEKQIKSVFRRELKHCVSQDCLSMRVAQHQTFSD